MSAYEKTLLEERAQAVHAARAILDAAAADKRSLTADEQQSVDRAFAEVDAKGKIVEDIRKAEKLDAEVRASMAGQESRPSVEFSSMDDAAILRSIGRGETRGYEFRDVAKTSTGAPVPTSFLPRIIEKMRWVGPMIEWNQTLNTGSGESLQIPSTNSYSTGSVTGEGVAYGESDPTFNAFVTLGAFKESVSYQITRELVEDNGVDLLGYLATNIGQALGYVVNNHLTVGTGTTQPTGVVTAAGSALTSGTSATFAYNDIVDLYYSLDAAVRRSPRFAFMGSTSAISRLRKLADTTGQPLWQPSVIAGQPDQLLGRPIVENPHMAAIGADAKPVIAGDFDSFMVRVVGGIRVESSTDFAFTSDLVTYKAAWRIDSALPQSSHIKYLRCAL